MNPVARRENTVVQAIGEETIVYDRSTDEAHCLNPTAALVWQHCDGSHSLDDLAGILGETATGPVDEAVVLAALDELAAAGLLAGAAPAHRRLSRKQVLLVAAGIGLLAPAVESIVAPHEAAALSV